MRIIIIIVADGFVLMDNETTLLSVSSLSKLPPYDCKVFYLQHDLPMISSYMQSLYIA